jgi:hypothetical protein
MEELNPDVASGQSNTETNSGEPQSDVTATASPQQAPVKKITWVKALTAILNGLGVGLLLGVMMSLSLSPVVSGVIAALTGLLAVLLGLNEKYIDPLKSIRIGAFGLFAVAGILLGLYLRANDPFTPSLLDMKNEYIELGYEEDEALAFITRFIDADTTTSKRKAHILYSSTVDAGACDMLVYTDETSPVNEAVNTFIEAGGTWKEFAETFKAELPEEIVVKSLLAMRDSFCNLATDGTIKMTNRDKVAKLNKNDSEGQIEQVLVSSGESWKAIEEKVSESIPEGQRKEVYLSIIKILTHD